MPENWTQLESARHGILTGEMHIEQFDSGKDPNFQPDRRVQRSPGFQIEARGLHKEIGNE